MGGSTAEQRIHCTGSAALEAEAVETTPHVAHSSMYAEEGAQLHALAEWYLGLEMTPSRRDCVVRGAELGLTVEDVYLRFWPAAEAVRSLFERHRVVEYDLEISHEHTRTCGPGVFGTCDILARSKDGYGITADFKFGQGIQVYAKENMQLGFYTVGAMDQDDPLVRDVSHHVFAIIQPWRDETVVSEWEATRSWVAAYQQLEQVAYHRIMAGDTALKAGKWCRFCRAKAICPEQQRGLAEFTGGEPPDLGRMTIIELANLLEQGRRAVGYLKTVERYAQALAEAGTQIPGYKLVKSVGHRRWAYEDAAEDAALSAGLTADDAYETVALSPAALGRVAKMKDRKLNAEPYTERPERGYRLVSDSDKAPQAQPNAQRLDIGELFPRGE